MIGGLKPHSGGKALASHLESLHGHEAVAIHCVGLASDTLPEAIEELGLMATGARTRTPLVHAWASPSIPYSEDDWEAYWQIFDEEFALEGQPFVEVAHLKMGGGRTAQHRHRAVLRVRADRIAIPLSHSYRRQEKVSRISEWRAGERLTFGRHSRWVIESFAKSGWTEIATAMRDAGFDVMPRPVAASPAERAAAERLGDWAADQVWAHAYEAWRSTRTAPDFIAALADSGLHIAMGHAGPVLISPGGTVHGLRRTLCNGAWQAGAGSIRKGDIEMRLAGNEFPTPDAVLAGLPQAAPSWRCITGLGREFGWAGSALERAVAVAAERDLGLRPEEAEAEVLGEGSLAYVHDDAARDADRLLSDVVTNQNSECAESGSLVDCDADDVPSDDLSPGF